MKPKLRVLILIVTLGASEVAAQAPGQSTGKATSPASNPAADTWANPLAPRRPSPLRTNAPAAQQTAMRT